MTPWHGLVDKVKKGACFKPITWVWPCGPMKWKEETDFSVALASMCGILLGPCLHKWVDKIMKGKKTYVRGAASVGPGFWCSQESDSQLFLALSEVLSASLFPLASSWLARFCFRGGQSSYIGHTSSLEIKCFPWTSTYSLAQSGVHVRFLITKAQIRDIRKGRGTCIDPKCINQFIKENYEKSMPIYLKTCVNV